MFCWLGWKHPSTVTGPRGVSSCAVAACPNFGAGTGTVPPVRRTIANTVITTYDRDFATAMTEFVRPAFEQDGLLKRLGRQSQTWARTARPGHGGWRVVAAHVSLLNLT